MYFKSRVDAGRQLAELIAKKYRNENCAIVALSDGAVVVAAQIAMELHCVMMLLLMEQINLPGEPDPVAVINQDGGFTYNNMFSTGQLEEFTSEYYQLIEQEKREKIHDINALLSSGGIIRKDLLRGHTIILVSDGLNNGFSLDSAADFLKPVKAERLIIATPLASVPAVDRMHTLADEIFCLSVVENYIETNHYYESNRIPSHEKIIDTIKTIMLQWK
jgi:putative phosphoribosyl transferase